MLEAFQAVGLLLDETAQAFERRFAASERDFAFASVVRCSLTGMDRKKGVHTADSPNVLPAFDATSEGHRFVQNCVDAHLIVLPPRTSMVILLGNTPAYVKALAKVLNQRRGPTDRINDVAYRSAGVVFVHIAHPSKGNGHFGAFIRGEGTAGAKRDLARQAIAAAS